MSGTRGSGREVEGDEIKRTDWGRCGGRRKRKRKREEYKLKMKEESKKINRRGIIAEVRKEMRMRKNGWKNVSW